MTAVCRHCFQPGIDYLDRGVEDDERVSRANRGGFNNLLGLHFTKAAEDEYVAEIEVADRRLQPYGLVHGGVYASIHDDQDHLVASGRVRRMVLDSGAAVAGRKVGLQGQNGF